MVGISASAALAAFMTLAAFPITLKGNVAEAMTGNPASTILTMTSASPSANLDLVVRNANGTFSTSPDLNSARFSITTDNYTGYKLLIAGTNDTKQLVNSASGTALESIATAMDAGVFGGDTATAFNGKWGYKPSKLNSTTNTNFLPAPTTSNLDTLDITNSANGTANNYIIALGARADYSTIPGTYTNTFVLTAVANNIPYTINFNDNTEDSTVANLPATISGDTTSTSVALPTTIPTRTGYTFAGWCDTVTTINANGTTSCTNPDTGVDGTVYPASTTTTTSYLDFIDQTVSSNIANLYTMWTINSYTITITNSNTTSGVNSLTIPFNGGATVTVTPASGYYLSAVSCPTGYTCTGYSTGTSYTGQQTVTITNNGTTAGGTLAFTGTLSMRSIQSITATTCTTTPQTVYDTRDNQQYVIQRLADGNCWMMTNLNLGAVTLSTDLTSSNTNLSTTITAANFNSYKKTSGSQSYTAAEYIPVSGNDTSSGGSGTPYGTFYNYCAASAGTICTADSNESNATYDICPKGWRLPTGGGSGEFQALYNNSSYNSPANMRKSYTQGGAAFALAGYLVNGVPTNQGSYGAYWASTRSGSTAMSGLFLGTSIVNPSGFFYRNNGYSIRCILKTTTTSISGTMQTMDDSYKLYANGSTGTVTDNRDNQTYTVAKINDQLWMTKNLAIGCNGSGTSYGSGRTSRSLTSSNSNVSSTWSTSSASDLTNDTSGSWTAAYMQCSATYGAWYNYMAATAGTISGSSNSTEASSSICPSGWRLPTYAEQQAITSYRSAFSPVTGGFYHAGGLATGVGLWWSSTAYSGVDRYALYYNGSSLGTGNDYRDFGLYVRCVRAS